MVFRLRSRRPLGLLALAALHSSSNVACLPDETHGKGADKSEEESPTSDHSGFDPPPVSVLEGTSLRMDLGPKYRYYRLDNTFPQGVLRVNQHTMGGYNYRDAVFVGDPIQILRFVYPCTEADGLGRWELVEENIEKLLRSLGNPHKHLDPDSGPP